MVMSWFGSLAGTCGWVAGLGALDVDCTEEVMVEDMVLLHDGHRKCEGRRLLNGKILPQRYSSTHGPYQYQVLAV
jgi:hypothetical protein